MNRRLPVTLIGGFLGAGKTSFLHHLISEHRGGHLAVFVENPGVLNPDAKALSGLCGAMRRLHDTVREIPAGDETAQVEWITRQLQECAEAGRFERVLIEVSGLTNAARLGQCFGLVPGQSEQFTPWAELHQIVCMVDALDFYRTSVVSSGNGSQDALRSFQCTQIASATLLILNKCDLIGDVEREASTRLLRQINPYARIIETEYGEVPTEIWSQGGTPRKLELMLEHQQAKSESRIIEPQADQPAPELTSTLYRAYRPFHPERFWEWFNTDHPGLLRVKGLVWLATRNLLVGGVSRTRWQNACGVAGIWWAALPREEWPEEPEALAKMQETWREPYGDRRQELMLIGHTAQLSDVVRRLNACLLDDEEYARPVKEWTALPDPFPSWDLEEE